MNQPIDILILSNGPGELATWVHPVVQELRLQLGNDRSQVRISVVLSPCANASGQEGATARRFTEIDRVQEAAQFFPFLLLGKTQDNWDWRTKGVVLFLGGDQFFPVVIGKRLGYRTVIYAEWEARWHSFVDRFGVMNSTICDRVAPKYAHKFTVVGDLMAEAGKSEGAEQGDQTLQPNPPQQSSLLIGLLPGSKPMKLTLGVPLTLAIAEHLHQTYPAVQFVIPVAPTLELQTLATYADPAHNPIIQKLGWASATLVMPNAADQLPILRTPSGAEVALWRQFPAYDVLSRCTICLTTIGANTAELGALAVPMLVLVPMHQLDIMRAWDGLPGLLVKLPGIGTSMATMISWLASLRPKLRAWPNIWAKREIVPEWYGEFQPQDVAAKVAHYLEHPEILQKMRSELRTVRGQPGAAEKLVQLVQEALKIEDERLEG
ncbi:lipid-A-disaccharide synthase [Phormidium sp. CLA17]|uniref:lipid-A-disaccharide synthase n=1 Tax=Leptolyngbya sp. Cla-17 TaxID=2803751 RepID=UPI0014916DD6|nr:lipid-A-disaccharide synthase [Leptolyngbya sp. Cla-17]MBM0741646.1 lipid-A-disaccharide synthase [Leptolyngbya sp. Cla-17]